MRIACPSCATAYELPASRLKPGKPVRCARCGGEWLPVEEAEEVAVEAQPDPTPPPEPENEIEDVLPAITAMDRLAATAPPPPRGSRLLLITAWIATFAVLGGAVVATLSWRDAIVRAWPPSGRILATTGQPPPAGINDKKPE